MKKLLNNLLRQLDKVVLAIMMVGLIATIAWQYMSLTGTLKLRQEVEGINLLQDWTDSAGKRHTKKKYPDLNTKQFNMNRDVQEIWRKPYTHGKWDDYAKAGDPRIFKHYPNPPNTLSDEYRRYMKEFGPGSLFDPHLFVFPKDEKNELVAFETVRVHYRPNNPDWDEDDGTIKPTKDPTKHVEPAAVAAVDLSDMIRLGKIDKPKLPFTLQSVAGERSQPAETWFLTFKVTSRRSEKFPVVKVGQSIPGTQYKVISARAETVIVKKFGAAVETDVYEVVVQSGDGPEIKMKQKEEVDDPLADPIYLLGFYPTGKRPIRLKDGQRHEFTFGDIRQTYLLTVEDGQAYIAPVSGKKTGERQTLKRWSNKDYNKWKVDQREKERRERDRGIEDEGGRRELRR